jgi:cytochrome c
MRSLILSTALLAGFSITAPAFAQDAEAGQRVFNQCRACHTVDKGGRNGVGPNLWGIVDRKENLTAYITNPKAVVPQGSMAFAGLRNEQQLKDLLAYLGKLKD